MLILYLDASGDPGQFTGKNSRYYVLAGLACKPEISHQTTTQVQRVLAKYFSGSLPAPRELHYSRLIQKKFPYNKMDAKSLADDIFGIIVGMDCVLFSMVLNKELHWLKYVRPWPPEEHMLEAMANRFQWFLERKGEVGILVADSAGAPSDKALLGVFEKYKAEGTQFKQLRNIVDTVFFTPSHTSTMLQLVDFCAYAVFSKYERGKDERFREIQPKFNEWGARIPLGDCWAGCQRQPVQVVKDRFPSSHQDIVYRSYLSRDH